MKYLNLKSAWIIACIFILNQVNLNAQGGWRHAEDAPNTSRFDDIYFTNDSTAYIGQNGMVYRSLDRGDQWQKIGELPNDAYIRSMEFINDSAAFIGTIYDAVGGVGFYATTDRGVSWTRIDDRVIGGMFGICGLDHIGNTIIGVGIYSEPGKFYISRDAGQSWTSKTVPLSAALVDCQMLNDSTYLVAGSSNPGRKANILKTTDYGQTWTEVAVSDAPTSYCWKLNINGNGFGIGSIEFAKTSFITHDFGNTWEEIFVNKNAPENLNLGGAAFLNDSLGWAGDQWNPGLWETKNGGKTWHYLDFGSAINKIKILDANTAIAVGKTVYIYNAETLGTKSTKEKTNFHTIKISPNPAGNELNISLELTQNTAVRLDLMDSDGKLVNELFRSSVNKGNWKKQFHINGLSPGNYYVWLRTNEGHMVKKVIIINN